MNLMNSPWLSFMTRDGEIVRAPPAAITDQNVIDFCLPREDFQGAAWQFLIGLLQVSCAPADRKTWQALWRDPPSREELQASFDRFVPAFELHGAGARFLQDVDSLQEARTASVASLLVEAPGEQALKQNTDHFTKRGMGDALCSACVALALYTLQSTGPAGGTGYRVGIRGGGPLTTLVLPAAENSSLWHKLLLNVLTRDVWPYSDPQPDDPRVFPWLGPTRTSEKGSPTPSTTPSDGHPLHVFWAMPNRIRLEDAGESGSCEVCGSDCAELIRQFRITNYGYNYEGAWRHPLTPYRQDPKTSDPPISMKGRQGGIGYRHWESMTLDDRSDRGYLPAAVVEDYLGSKHAVLQREGSWQRHATLWVFGYDMKQNKPRAWDSTRMPLIPVPAEDRDRLLHAVRALVDAAEAVVYALRNAVKAAWFGRPKDAKGDFSFVDQQFWGASSTEFYACLEAMSDRLESQQQVLSSELAKRWHTLLRRLAMDAFDDIALSCDEETADLKRIIAARERLRKDLRQSKAVKHLREFMHKETAA